MLRRQRAMSLRATVAGNLAAQLSQAAVNCFAATLAFGNLTLAEATAS